MLTKKELISATRVHPEAPDAKETGEAFDQAKAALEANSCEELYKLWEKAVADRGALLDTVGITFKHLKGETPIYQPQQAADVIAAMEHVALAAIDLAKSIALPKSVK